MTIQDLQHYRQIIENITNSTRDDVAVSEAKQTPTLADLGYKAPFSASGLWVEDARGKNVCETTRDLAPAIAKTLNQIHGG